MVSLIDLGPAKGTVTVRGEQAIDIVGLTAKSIIEILVQFPEIRKILTSDAPDPEVVQQLIMRFPDAAALVIAAGTGVDVTDKEAREPAVAAALALPLGEQFDIFTKVLELSFPRGVRSFLDGVQGLVVQAGGRGWAPAMTSPAQSNGASPMGDPSKTA
jgi:hypothetical protein